MDLLAQAKEMTPEEVASLLLRVEKLQSDNHKLGDQNSELQDKNNRLHSKSKELKAVIQDKEALIRWLKSQVFGATSERRVLEELTPQDQLWLGEQMLEHTDTPPPPDVTVAAYERKQRGQITKFSEECSSSRLKFDDSVPVEEIRVKDPELAKRDPEKVEFIGEEVTHRLAQRSSYVVLKYVRQVWRDKGEDKVHKMPASAGIIDRSLADVSFLAELAKVPSSTASSGPASSTE